MRESESETELNEEKEDFKIFESSFSFSLYSIFFEVHKFQIIPAEVIRVIVELTKCWIDESRYQVSAIQRVTYLQKTKNNYRNEFSI